MTDLSSIVQDSLFMNFIVCAKDYKICYWFTLPSELQKHISQDHP